MANFNFNKVILGGRLVADPELKTTQGGVSVTSFRIAVNRRTKEGSEADFFTVVAWRQTAEFITKFFRKGSNICVVGSLQNREWTGQDGNKRTVTEVQADEAFFVDARSEMPQSPAQAEYNPYAVTAATAPKFEEIGDDEPLPF